MYLLSPFIFLFFFQFGKNPGIWVKASIISWIIDRNDFMDFYETGKNPEIKMEICVPALTFHFSCFFLIWYKKTGIWVKHEYHQLNQWKTWYYGFLRDWKKIQKSKWREVYLLSPFILLDFFQIGKNPGIWVKSEYHQLNQWKTWYYGFLRDWKKSRNQNGDRCTCSHLSFFLFLFQFGKNPGIWVKASIISWIIDRNDIMDFYKTGKNPEVKMEIGVPALTFHFFVFCFNLVWKKQEYE